jgi:hypothetical protein
LRHRFFLVEIVGGTGPVVNLARGGGNAIKDMIFGMLTAAFDAGGDESTPVLSVAGFASSADDWHKFSDLWSSRLAKDNITYFRAVDAAFFRGPFQHWRDRTDRESLRRSLFFDLMEILKSHTYRKFGCTIINGAFNEMNPQLKAEFSLVAYSIAGRTCEKRLREWVIGEWKNPDTGIELVFEEGDKGKGKLQKRLADDGCFTPTFKPKKDLVGEDGKIIYGFVPLQAADWLAYELSLAVKNAEAGKLAESDQDFRWAFREFLTIPGNPGVFTVNDMKQFERMLELSKDLAEWWKQFPKP